MYSAIFIKCTKKKNLKYTKWFLLKPVILTDNYLQGNISSANIVYTVQI